MAKKTNCVKNGVPYYRISATIGYKENGKPQRKDFYGSCKADAEAQRDKYLKRLEDGLVVGSDKLTVGQLMRIWLYEIKRCENKPGTFVRYEESFRNDIQNSDFAIMPICEVVSLHVQRYLNAMADAGKSPSEIKNTYKVVKMFINYCLTEGYIGKDPCKNVAVPGNKPEKPVIETFTDEEVAILKDSLTGHRLRFLILLALGTGLRQGELLALRYCDIVDGAIKVTRSLSFVTHIERDGNRHSALEVQSPKSKDSIREVPIPTALIPELHAHKQRQAIERMAAGLGKNEEDLIFTTESGKFIERGNLRRAYIRILKKAGVEYKKFHCLRHTYATNLIQGGVDIKTVAELLGHSDISVTMIYLHSDTQTKKKAADSINALFG